MIEIYANIPQTIREQAKFWADMALSQKNGFDAARMMNEYLNSCENEEEKDFVNFYFKLRIAELNHENSTN